MYSLAKLSEQSNKRTPEKHLFSGVLAHLTGFEPVAYRLGGVRSILLGDWDVWYKNSTSSLSSEPFSHVKLPFGKFNLSVSL